METTFHNVLITISAKTPEEAYYKLCKLLHTPGVEYTTDTFTIYQSGKNKESTEKLFPKE
jgi:hypothetical protein